MGRHTHGKREHSLQEAVVDFIKQKKKCQRLKERNSLFKSAPNVIPTMRVASTCRGQTYTDLLAVLPVKPLDTLTPMLTEIPVSSGPKRLSMSTLLTQRR